MMPAGLLGVGADEVHHNGVDRRRRSMRQQESPQTVELSETQLA